VNALYSDTTGTQNLALGVNALYENTTGSYNATNGVNSLYHNTTGSSNLALGTSAGYNLTTGSNNVDIANQGVAADAGKIRIGTSGTQTAAFMAGVSGVTISGPTKTVVINSSGQLGTAPAGTAPTASSVQTTQRAPELSPTRALGLRLGKTSAQVRRQQHQINQLTAQNAQFAAQNAQLATEIAQLRALVLHRH
jgi:hypothetical protein